MLLFATSQNRLIHNLNKSYCNVVRRSFFGKKKEAEERTEMIANPIEEEQLMEQKLTEEQVMRIRDKTRLPERIKARLEGRMRPEHFKFLRHWQRNYVKMMYGLYGKASGLNPGVMWPDKEELDFRHKWDKAFSPTLQEMVDKVQAKKQAEIDYRVNREKEILANLKKLPKWKEEFFEKYRKMNEDEVAEKLKKEKLIEEVRNFLGYNVDPEDPRFQEALLRKEEEEKKVSKASKKQERQAWAMEKLKELADEAMEKERQEQEMEMKKREAKEAKKLKETKSEGTAEVKLNDKADVKLEADDKTSDR